jgi:GNAT superfamily N-acetyltransferase
VGRRVVDLSLATLHELPSPCRACVFWESRDGRRGGTAGDPGVVEVAKEAWWQATQLEWGPPGKGVFVDDHLVAYALFAPRDHFPRARRLGPAPSDDALLLATIWVDPAYRGAGLATTLLQSVLRETHRRGARALECYGDRLRPAALAEGACVLPEAFLLQSGFRLRQDHHEFPLLRLDLRQTVRWQESVGHALEGVVAALSRRERAPAPAPAQVSPASVPPAEHHTLATPARR